MTTRDPSRSFESTTGKQELPSAQATRTQDPRARLTERRADHRQLQLSLRVALLVACTLIFLAVGLPAAAVVSLVLAFLSLRSLRRPPGHERS